MNRPPVSRGLDYNSRAGAGDRPAGADILGHSSGRQSLKGEFAYGASRRPVFIPCRRVAAPGVVRSSEIAGFHPPVDNDTWLTETTVIPIFGPRQRVYRLNRGGLEVVAWGSGFRQAGGCLPAVGKDPNTGAVGWKSVAAAAPFCGEPPTADFDIAP